MARMGLHFIRAIREIRGSKSFRQKKKGQRMTRIKGLFISVVRVIRWQTLPANQLLHRF